MNIHVIIGPDDYRIERVAAKTVGDGVGLEVVDSLNATNAESQMADLRKVIDSVSTPPWFDPRKVTWWKNVHFLPGGKSSGEVKEALERFAETLAKTAFPENQHVILSGPRLLKASVFAKRLTGAAEMIVFSEGKPWEKQREAVAFVLEQAEAQSLAFAAGAADRFVSVVGTDARSLVSELGKMRDYLEPGVSTVTVADVDAIASPGVLDEPEVWGVTDAIGARDAKKALAALRPFEQESGFAVFLSGVIEKFFRQMIDVKRGKTDGMNPFVLRKSEGFARNWTLGELRLARARFMRLREQVVSGTVSGDVLVVTELVRALKRFVLV